MEDNTKSGSFPTAFFWRRPIPVGDIWYAVLSLSSQTLYSNFLHIWQLISRFIIIRYAESLKHTSSLTSPVRPFFISHITLTIVLDWK